jgi:hypothetical protein
LDFSSFVTLLWYALYLSGGVDVDYYVCDGDDIADLLCPLLRELSLVFTLPVWGLTCRWWRAFFTAGASSVYIFLHSLLYWMSKLSLGGFTSNVLYLGYSLLLTFLYFILTGLSPRYIGLTAREYWVLCDVFLYEEDLWEYQD